MTQVHSKALEKTISVERILYKIKTNDEGPVVIFFAGVHGNETAGVFGLEEVLQKINPESINGTVYAISGNLKALGCNQRYLDEDLNRIWTKEQLQHLKTKEKLNSEEKEQLEVLQVLEVIINTNSGPFYFIDFHTTSSKTLPFITINDTLNNRDFAKLYPVPIVLGIEEYLDGPLLSYINELGYVSLGFESGQHDDAEAVSNCISFIYLTLVFTSAIDIQSIIGYQIYYNQLQRNSRNLESIFEVVHLHRIKKGENFKMIDGFESFQNIKKGTVIATNNNKSIVSTYNAKIFMPLYQAKGEDGFFVIKLIKPFFLNLSTFLRTIKIDSLLVCLPGISWEDQKKEVLKANLKVTKFFAKSFFHLLGYRNKKVSANYMLLYNRERASKGSMYRNEIWQKKPHLKDEVL
jgi:succinylglutamate desuccinylase